MRFVSAWFIGFVFCFYSYFTEQFFCISNIQMLLAGWVMGVSEIHYLGLFA